MSDLSDFRKAIDDYFAKNPPKSIRPGDLVEDCLFEIGAADVSDASEYASLAEYALAKVTS